MSRKFFLIYFIFFFSVSIIHCLSQTNEGENSVSGNSPRRTHAALRTDAEIASPSPYILLNQRLNEGLHSTLDIENVDTVFHTIFSQLPDSVYVYPTENYYYFIFYASGRCFWGNVRLGVEERDSGYFNFIYWEFDDDPKSPDTPHWSKKYGKETDVSVTKRAPLRYAITAQGKTVIFQLNEIGQVPPKLFSLPEDEEFLSRTCDESGYEFFLIYRKTHTHFMWVLNEERGIPGYFISLTDSIVIDKTSGFAFYLDRAHGDRKILIGVRAQNVRRNNYWDGPFDQLADNDIHVNFIKDVNDAYPYTKGRVDRFGIFTDQVASRLAITPYIDYESEGELKQLIRDCRKQASDEFLTCITYDYKTSFGRVEEKMKEKDQKKKGKKKK